MLKILSVKKLNIYIFCEAHLSFFFIYLYHIQYKLLLANLKDASNSSVFDYKPEMIKTFTVNQVVIYMDNKVYVCRFFMLKIQHWFRDPNFKFFYIFCQNFYIFCFSERNYFRLSFLSILIQWKRSYLTFHNSIYRRKSIIWLKCKFEFFLSCFT